MSGQDRSQEQELQTLAYSVRILRDYLSDLVSRETLVSRLIADHKAALEAIESLPSGDAEVPCMMPLGGGVSVPATVRGSSMYLVAIGAGVFMKKGRDETVAFLDRKLKELESALREVAEQRRRVEEELAKLEDSINAIYGAAGAGSARCSAS